MLPVSGSHGERSACNVAEGINSAIGGGEGDVPASGGELNGGACTTGEVHVFSEGDLTTGLR